MANNRVQVKRTSTSGRTPNTTGSYATNTQYISAGELALNMADGILYSSNGSAVIEVGANNTNVNISGNLTVKAIIANGSIGASGQTLTSNGSATYWSPTGTGTVTSVGSGNGLTGGAITTTGTLSVLANNGITANSTGLFVTPGTGTVVNATGVHVNATYINTISSNLAYYVIANSGIVSNATGVYVNATYIGTLSANNSSYLGGTAAASYQLNSTLNANIASYLPTYTGVVNGSSHSVGTAFTANATVVNAVSYYAGTTLIGNTTGPYGKAESALNVNSSLTSNNSSYLGGTIASSYQLNSTLNANIASYLPTYTGVVNGSSHSVGTSTVANATGIWTTGTVNAASQSVGTSFVANTSQVTISGIPLSANGSTGTAAWVLTSNGATGSPYWAAAAAGTNTSAQYTWTNTHTFTSNIQIGNSSAYPHIVSNFGYSNPNTFGVGTLTTNASLNTVLVGPYTIASGNSLVITTGSRVVII